MLARGPRVFHVNTEGDTDKLIGWLKKGPRYESVETYGERKIYLWEDGKGGKPGHRIGIVVVMAKNFALNEVLPIVEKFKAKKVGR